MTGRDVGGARGTEAGTIGFPLTVTETSDGRSRGVAEVKGAKAREATRMILVVKERIFNRLWVSGWMGELGGKWERKIKG
jgi:hypothetical protein